MKTVLSIGSVKFISNDATSAATVADLIGQMVRVEERWTECEYPASHVLIQNHSRYSHRVEIQSLEAREVFESEAAFLEWQAKQPKEATEPTPESEGK